MKRAQMRSDRKNISVAVLYRYSWGHWGVAIWYLSGVFRVYDHSSFDMYSRFDYWQIAEQYLSCSEEFVTDIKIVVPNYSPFMVVNAARNWIYSCFPNLTRID